ncbi:hypothetical protein [Streptomyces malaysiensis]|uniref:hypothetical protein n=1 Tax=Streptomyces malaysiensis TaxID=92644 RepID=UPI002B3063A1|nr:hypothetical protein R8789_45195 [Streptomyces malaysiensis]
MLSAFMAITLVPAVATGANAQSPTSSVASVGTAQPAAIPTAAATGTASALANGSNPVGKGKAECADLRRKIIRWKGAIHNARAAIAAIWNKPGSVELPVIGQYTQAINHFKQLIKKARYYQRKHHC